MKKLVVLSILVLVLGVAAMAVMAAVSAQGVVPILVDTGPGGNVECSQVGDYELSSGRINYPFEFDGDEFSPFNVSTDGTYVSWSGDHNGLAVILKGGPAAHVYVYGLDPYYNWDSGLASPPVGAQQNPAGLSNLTFCWNPPDEDNGQWCSPGYWRQEHHLDSWEATGISPDELYSDYFGAPTLSRQGQREGAPTDPTLWEVLQKPQWYGGEAFNNVGDLLSAAHPDVNFEGERVEDSCPLN